MNCKEEDNWGNLSLASIRLHNFRNYEQLSLEDLGKLSIIVGNNAVGKTNIIEAIQLLTDLSSFRTSTPQELIKWGETKACIESRVESDNRSIDLSLKIEDGSRQYYFNGNPRNKKTLINMLPAVIFSPDDLLLVKGSSSKRRDSIDNIGIHLSQNFRAVRSDYQKLVKQKNQALKDGMSHIYIESINEILLKVGVQYILHRFALLEVFIPYLQKAHDNITTSASTLNISYAYSWDDADHNSFSSGDTIDKKEIANQYEIALQSFEEQEYASKRSMIGPHADRLEFVVDGVSARKFSSQGQQRSIVLSFKVAELKSIQNVCHQKPVLLLDDVMSELDADRRKRFMDMVKDTAQTFITTTNLSYFEEDILENAAIYRLPLGGD